MKILISVILVSFLIGCATNPNARRVQLSKPLYEIAKQADLLQKAGVISNETENRINDLAVQANKINYGFDMPADCNGLSRARCIDKYMDAAIELLGEEK